MITKNNNKTKTIKMDKYALSIKGEGKATTETMEV